MLVSISDGTNIRPDPDCQVISAQNLTEIPGSIESQGPDIEGRCLFHFLYEQSLHGARVLKIAAGYA